MNKLIQTFMTLVTWFILISSCTGQNEIVLEIKDVKNVENFELNPPPGTFKATIALNSLSNEPFKLEIIGGSKFTRSFEIKEKGSTVVYDHDWYDEPMKLIYVGNPGVTGKVIIKIKFHDL